MEQKALRTRLFTIIELAHACTMTSDLATGEFIGRSLFDLDACLDFLIA